MKTFQEIKRIIQSNKKDLEDRFGVRRIGIFGSYVRGEQDRNSDLDMLVDIQRPVGLVKFIKLENYLSDILEIKVDMVTKKALKPYIGREILKEIQYV